MSIPIVGKTNADTAFPVLLARVRQTLTLRYGTNQAKPFLLLCDLMEIHHNDKQDRASV